MSAPSLSRSRRVVQICPADDGVRDYAKVLDARFAEMGLSHITIVVRKGEQRLLTPPGFEFDRDDILLVNFSPYGYDPRGLCFWLVSALRELRRKQQIGGIATFFHELDDDSPPWKRGFYLSLAHKYLCYSMQAASDCVLTNSAFHADRLQRLYFGRERAVILPIYSTVGEPGVIPAYDKRQTKAVMFGLEANRRRGFKAFGADGLRRLPVTEIVEIGGGASVADGVPGWRFLGRLPASEISRHMLEARFGLVTHRPRNLTKSTVFAAYAAHGCIPVIPPVRPGGEDLSDGLVSGSNVVLLADLPEMTESSLSLVGPAIHQWYSAYNSREAAQTILDAMADLVTAPVPSAA